MRKLFYYFLCVAIVGAITISCKDDKECPVVPEVPEVPGKETVGVKMESVVATYLGEKESQGEYSFDFYAKAPDSDGKLAANSSGLHLELYSAVVADKNLLEAVIEPGTYVVKDKVGDFTILTGNSTRSGGGSYYFTTDANGVMTKKDILTGDVYFVISEGNQAAFTSDLQYEVSETSDKWVTCQYNGKIEIEPVYDMIYTSDFPMYYWGDDEWDHPGIAEYMVLFYDGDYDGNGLNEGSYIGLSYYTDLAPKGWEARIPVGTYNSSTEYKKDMIYVATPEVIETEPESVWGYTMHQTIIDGVETLYFVTEGSSTVDMVGDEYILKFNFLLDNGKRYLAKYVGAMRLVDEYTKSTLKSDVTVGSLDYGYLEYNGVSYRNKGVNRWYLRLYDEAITVYPEDYWAMSGEGEYMDMTLYTDILYTTDIPMGKYNISEEEVPFHVSTGQGGYGITFGTWYHRLAIDKEGELDYADSAPAVTGTVTLSKTDDKYKIDIEFLDDKGNTITATYNAPLTYMNTARSRVAPDSTPEWVYKNPVSSYEATKAMRVKNNLIHKSGK